MTDAKSLEAIVGAPPAIILMKQVGTLDEGCRSVFRSAPVAGFGFRDRQGIPHTTVVGGGPGFAHAESPTRFSFEVPADGPGPGEGSGVSFVFLMPGLGETLRLNGTAVERSGTNVVVEMKEAYVHCAKCIRRSRLWDEVPVDSAPKNLAVAEFLASSSFVLVSSWDAGGSSDTSPKGDAPGFIRMLDDQTLAIPDRKGNKRTDTFHNLLTCDEISLAALAPGRDDVLHMGGTAYVTDDPALLSTMAVKDGERLPHAALIIRVQRAEILANEAVRMSRMWDRSAHVDRSQAPDMNRIAAQHIASSKAPGAKASMTRVLSKGLAAAPSKLVERAMDVAYRKDLEDEGY
ncbi:MAG: pyridoxamine 5'-phosphate oxidase family protein [Candidatus Binatia bacterium]